MASGVLNQSIEVRAQPRDEVHFRSRIILGAARRAIPVLVVNLSAGGLMVRSDTEAAVGDAIRVQLPIVGETQGVIRWALGGRIGCQFDRPIAPTDYRGVLAAMQGDGR